MHVPECCMETYIVIRLYLYSHIMNREKYGAIKEVVKIAEVSIQTVSCMLNVRLDGFSEACKQLRQGFTELNFRPKILAHA